MKIERKGAGVERKTTAQKRGRQSKRGYAPPNFGSLFDETGMENPLEDIEYTGDIEADSRQEQSAALRHVIAHKKSMREQWRVTVDTEFWFAVCFQSREQKETFLQKAGLSELGDKYLDGLRLAEKFGIMIEEIALEARRPDKPPRGLRERKHFLGGD